MLSFWLTEILVRLIVWHYALSRNQRIPECWKSVHQNSNKLIFFIRHWKNSVEEEQLSVEEEIRSIIALALYALSSNFL